MRVVLSVAGKVESEEFGRCRRLGVPNAGRNYVMNAGAPSARCAGGVPVSERIWMADDLFLKAVVTIRTKDGLEIDLTDDPAEHDRRVTSGRLVFYSWEIKRMKEEGMTPEGVALLVPVLTEIPGGLIERVEPSSGPYPWDKVEVGPVNPPVPAEPVRTVRMPEKKGEQGSLW